MGVQVCGWGALTHGEVLRGHLCEQLLPWVPRHEYDLVEGALGHKGPQHPPAGVADPGNVHEEVALHRLRVVALRLAHDLRREARASE